MYVHYSTVCPIYILTCNRHAVINDSLRDFTCSFLIAFFRQIVDYIMSCLIPIPTLSKLGIWIVLQRNGSELRWIDGEPGNDDNIFWAANRIEFAGDSSTNPYMNENGETNVAENRRTSFFT